MNEVYGSILFFDRDETNSFLFPAREARNPRGFDNKSVNGYNNR